MAQSNSIPDGILPSPATRKADEDAQQARLRQFYAVNPEGPRGPVYVLPAPVMEPPRVIVVKREADREKLRELDQETEFLKAETAKLKAQADHLRAQADVEAARAALEKAKAAAAADAGPRGVVS